ncbi:5884_t:CDS:2 [Paraglomus brasilianum]|uniref:5884_t:CDS:1 n=1 Tax=Paraglomus brasilianum TaxID=144538 RepID=A0A9N8W4M3_9GLOM|nr:5884_t:CDS:2 [Paraglomus brasilianum]
MENNGTTTTTTLSPHDDDDSRHTDKPLSHALKVLTYLATADIITSSLFILNIAYTAINGEVLPDKSCLTVGLMTASVYAFIKHAILDVMTGNFGQAPQLCQFVCAQLIGQTLGQLNTGMKCLETTGKHSLAIAGLGITFATFLICAVCYLAIMAKLKSSGKELVKTTEHAIKHAAIERSVLRRITGYILIFFVKWLPAYICVIGFFGGHTKPWAFMVVIISINLGGPGYAIQYLLSEGFSDDSPGSCEQSIIRQSTCIRSPNPSFIQSESTLRDSTLRDSTQSSTKKSNSHINVLVVPPSTFHY